MFLLYLSKHPKQDQTHSECLLTHVWRQLLAWLPSFPVPSKQHADPAFRIPATLAPASSGLTGPCKLSLSQRTCQEAFPGAHTIPRFSDTLLLPTPRLLPSPPRFRILLPTIPGPKDTTGPTSSPRLPTQKPGGGKVLSLFFVNSPLITPAIPQSVCTVIVEFDAND